MKNRYDEAIKESLAYPEHIDFAKKPKEKTETKYTKLIRRYKKEHWIGCGRHRAAFRRKNVVVKIPLNDQGVRANECEAMLWKKHGRNGFNESGSPIVIARCRLYKHGILVMEYVDERQGYIDYVMKHGRPNWTSRVDCGQVGINKKGLVVAYDYAWEHY